MDERFITVKGFYAGGHVTFYGFIYPAPHNAIYKIFYTDNADDLSVIHHGQTGDTFILEDLPDIVHGIGGGHGYDVPRHGIPYFKFISKFLGF